MQKDHKALKLKNLKKRLTKYQFRNELEVFYSFVESFAYVFIVKFIIEHKVHWQEQLAVVGSIPELGSWNASEAVKMFWNQDNVWSVEVIVPRKYANFEWKFVILKNNDVAWESRQNRWFELNDQCHVTLNNKWNEWYNCVLYKRFSFCTIFKLDYIAKPTFTSLGDSSLSKYRDKL